MAKEKFVFETELDIKGLSKSAKQAQKEIREIANEARATSKNAKITGDVTMKAKGIQETNKALRLAKDNVDRLTKGLAEAKMSGATEKQVQSLESQLRKASTQAINLKSDLARMGQGGPKSNIFGGIVDSAKEAGSSLLNVGSKIGNIFSGVKAGVDIATGAIQKVTGVVGGFAGRLTSTYDDQVRAQKVLTSTLSDGAEGYKAFNSHIEKGSSLLKSQKGDLNELAGTLSGYTQMSGEQAFKTVNAINAVGDSLAVSMDGQKQFTLGLAQAMGTGALHAQDYNQIMQTALGAEFKRTLIEATNQLNGVKVSTDDMVKSLQQGDISKNTISSLFGDDWAKKMAEYQTSAKGVEVSTSGVSRMLKEGKISADDFSRVLGQDFIEKLTNSQNALGGMEISQENFKQAMEDGVFGTEQMNKALEMFQAKGEEVASSGASTFSQIGEMVVKGFDQSALAGFQDRMADTGTNMAELGDSATELSSMAGTALGQLAANGVNHLTRLMDKNNDGKVSNDEFKQTFNDVKKVAENFFKKVDEWDIGGFLNNINSAISFLGGFMQTIADTIGWVQSLFSWLGKAGDKWDNFVQNTSPMRNRGGSGGGGSFLVQPFSADYMSNLGAGKPMGAMSEPLPLYLQQFAQLPKIGSFDTKALGSIGRTATNATQSSTSNTFGDFVINTTASNGDEIANQFYRRLERNGIKLNRK